MKKIIVLLMTLILALGTISTASAAVKYPDPNSNSNKSIYKVYNYRPGDCVLSSCTHMLKRSAIYKKDSKWGKIDNESVRKVACYNTDGWNNDVRYSFTYKTKNKKYTVNSASFSGNRLKKIKSLLSKHPEGVVVYNTYYPHAVLAVYCKGNTVYCVDSAHNTQSNNGGHNPKMNNGIEKYSKTILKGYSIESLSRYWYVSKVK